MASDLNELESFKHFLEAQIDRGVGDLSPEESVQLWRVEFSKSVEAVREALNEMEAGDSGRPLRAVAEQIRDRHGWALGRATHE